MCLADCHNHFHDNLAPHWHWHFQVNMQATAAAAVASAAAWTVLDCHSDYCFEDWALHTVAGLWKVHQLHHLRLHLQPHLVAVTEAAAAPTAAAEHWLKDYPVAVVVQWPAPES